MFFKNKFKWKIFLLVVFVIFIIWISISNLIGNQSSKVNKFNELSESSNGYKNEAIDEIVPNYNKELNYSDKDINFDVSFNDVLNSDEYIGDVISWQAKISSYYSQISGIKFCIVDEDHQNVDIDKPCDWFWALSDATMNADNLEINPNWDGHWVNFILNYYKVPFNEDLRFYNDIYTIKGIIYGIDCGMNDKCIPNVDIISIVK